MNLAIKITCLRILLAPLFVWSFIKIQQGVFWVWLSLFLAVISELSDLFDGLVARKYNLVTTAGKILDPLADSLSRFSIFFAFFCLGYADYWMILVFFYRDSIVSTLRILAATKNMVIAARTSGKIKAVGQAIAIFGVFLVILLNSYQIHIPVSHESLTSGFMYFAVTITIYSLLDYISFGRQFFLES